MASAGDGTCGFHGRYFEGRTGVGRPLVYLAVRDGVYAPATAVIVEDVP